MAKSCSNLIINKMNDSLNVEEDSLILNNEVVSLTKLTNECIEVLKFKAIEKGIELRIEGNEGDTRIVTDGNRAK